MFVRIVINMKKILKLNEEQDGLKLIQVNDGFVVVDLKNRENVNWFLDTVEFKNEITHSIHKNDSTSYAGLISRRFTDSDYKIIFAASNLNLEGVPVIEKNEEWIKVAVENEDNATINNPEHSQSTWYKGVELGYKQAQRDLFTEEDMREIFYIAGGYGYDFKKSLAIVKQPKVEIEFENGKPKSCIFV